MEAIEKILREGKVEETSKTGQRYGMSGTLEKADVLGSTNDAKYQAM